MILMKLKYLTYRPFLHTCLLFFIFIGGSSCNYLPGSTTLCRIHLSGKEATYDLHLKRPYNDISMVFPIEAYKQIGDVMVQATVTNTGKTKPRIFYHERMPKIYHQVHPFRKLDLTEHWLQEIPFRFTMAPSKSSGFPLPEVLSPEVIYQSTFFSRKH